MAEDNGGEGVQGRGAEPERGDSIEDFAWVVLV